MINKIENSAVDKMKMAEKPGNLAAAAAISRASTTTRKLRLSGSVKLGLISLAD